MADSTEYSLRSKFPIVFPSGQVMSALSHQTWAAQAFEAFRGVGLRSSHNLMNTLLLALTALYVCWRLWKFTFQPYLRPEAPKELPYWIPFLGHSLAFFKKSDFLLEQGLNYTGRTHEIYAIQVWRQKMYVVTNPPEVAAAYKNNTALNFDGHLNELLINYGFKGDALRLSWHVPQPGDACYIPNNPINPQQKSLNRLTEDVYKKQLLPGEKMEFLCQVFITALENSMKWDLLDFCTVNETACHKTISLRAMCRHAMVDAATRSMFGSHLHQIEPDVIHHMLGFNDLAWMVFFRYPDTFGSPVDGPRNALLKALKIFITLPEAQRSEQSWAVKTVLAAQDIVGIDLQSKASVMLMIYWAANSNEYNISFWLIAHLLFNEDLLHTVRTEIEAAWKDQGLDRKHLCANSPTLDAMFHEALRLNGGAMVARKVLEPLKLGGKLLLKGHTVLIPSRQLHMNEQVWGSNVNEFDAARFAKDKSLTRHSSFRPFGGGVTYCPGRVLAKEEVFGFIAIFLHRFDLKLAKPTATGQSQQKFPRLDDTIPALGISGPIKGTDIFVDLTIRS